MLNDSFQTPRHRLSIFRFYIYKLPRPHGGAQEEGLKYLLLQEQSEGWTEGGGLVGDVTGALGRSLGPLYEVRLNCTACIMNPCCRFTLTAKCADVELHFLFFLIETEGFFSSSFSRLRLAAAQDECLLRVVLVPVVMC